MVLKFPKIFLLLFFLPFLIFCPYKEEISIPQSSASLTTLSFSGYEWIVRTTTGELSGPGPNYFNDSIQNVWIDTNASLHLRITHEICEDIWYCAEVISVDSFGYGTYQFVIEPSFERLDKNVVLGLFTYLDDFNEIDIEFARWGDDTEENSQYVLQPWWGFNHRKRFDFNPQEEQTTTGFTWCKNIIDFWTYTNSSEFRWTYYGPSIPTPSTEHAHMNLWLVGSTPPSDYSEAEIVIRSFEFIPFQCLNFPLSFWWIILISVIGLGTLITTTCILIIRKRKKRTNQKFI